ncbi:uncharacterized protein [Ptychodera flava]|uniref:uncharacterized protein n=1 Tax=Ptychodera flava TaxID=63121 RepID=UPI00396A105D
MSGQLTCFDKKNNKQSTYRRAVVADTTAAIEMFVWSTRRDHIQLLEASVGKRIDITQIFKRQVGISINNSSSISSSGLSEGLPSEVSNKAHQLKSYINRCAPTSDTSTLQDALADSTKYHNIVGKIIKIHSTKTTPTRKHGNTNRKSVIITDQSGPHTLTLWGSLCNSSSIGLNNIILVQHVIKSYQFPRRFVTQPNSAISMATEETPGKHNFFVPDHINLDNVSDDSDADTFTTGTVVGLSSIIKTNRCPNSSCQGDISVNTKRCCLCNDKFKPYCKPGCNITLKINDNDNTEQYRLYSKLALQLLLASGPLIFTLTLTYSFMKKC